MPKTLHPPFACYHCGKVIRGTVVHHVPPNYLIALGLDFPRAYHPKCKEAENAAADRAIARAKGR